MIIISSKKTHIVLCAGNNISEYENDFYRDNDTLTLYQKSLVDINTIDVLENDEIVFRPSKYIVRENKIIQNPYFKEPYTFSETMYNIIQSNIDYLMLLNDPDSAVEESV